MAILIVPGRALARRGERARLLMDHGRAHGIVKVRVARLGQGGRAGRITVWYADGARGRHDFPSFDAAVRWVEGRKSWKLARDVDREESGAVLFRPAE